MAHYDAGICTPDEFSEVRVRALYKLATAGDLSEFLIMKDSPALDEALIDAEVAETLRALLRQEGANGCAHPRGVEPEAMIAAADKTGIGLGFIHQCMEADEIIVQLDLDSVADAEAWAAVETLPAWIAARYRKVTTQVATVHMLLGLE